MNKHMNRFRLIASVLFAVGTLHFATSASGDVMCGMGGCIGQPNSVIVDTNTNGVVEPGVDQDITTSRGMNGSAWVDILNPWQCNPISDGNRVWALSTDGGMITSAGRFRAGSLQLVRVDPGAPVVEGVPTGYLFENQGGSPVVGYMRYLDTDVPPNGVFDSVEFQLNDADPVVFPLVETTDGDGNRYISYGWGRTANFTNVRNACGPMADGRSMIPQIWLRLTATGQIVFDADGDGNQDPDIFPSPPLEGGANDNIFFVLFNQIFGGGVSIPTLGELAMILLVLSLVISGWSAARGRLVGGRPRT
jgi:hypothetical protein